MELHGASMSYEYKEKDAREIALLFLAVFIVGIYLFREWRHYPVEKGARGQGFKGSSVDLESITSAAKEDKQRYDKGLVPLTPASVSGEAKQVLGLKIDINKATQFDFESLPGIGPKLAQRIIEKRNELGAFKTIDDIKKVKGIGEKKFGKIKDLINAR